MTVSDLIPPGTHADTDPLLLSQPRLRRDVLFTRVPGGVLFHNARGGFQLNGASAYRFATLVVPYLDGSRTLADLVAGFPQAQRAGLVNLVRALYTREFARDAADPGTAPGPAPAADVAERFASQIAYIDHYIAGAPARFQRFRTTRTTVVGTGEIARWVVLSLVRNGAGAVRAEAAVLAGAVQQEAAALAAAQSPVALDTLPTGGAVLSWSDLAGADIVVVAGGPQAVAQLQQLTAAGVPEGVTLLAAWNFGNAVVVGPQMAADREGCWACAALRLSGNGDQTAAAEFWTGLALPSDATAHHDLSRPHAAMVGNMLGYEVFRITTGALPAETDGQVLVQERDSLDVVSEPLLPHPACPHCATAVTELGDITPQDGADDVTVLAPDGTVTIDPVAVAAAAEITLAEVEKAGVLVRSRVGVFREYADDDWTQSPLKVATVDVAVGPQGTRRLHAFDLHHLAGARRRVLHTAARTYTDHVVPLAGRIEGHTLAVASQVLPRIEPSQLVTATGIELPEDAVWVEGQTLPGRERVLVPAEAVKPFRGDGFADGPVGSGAGSSVPAAVAQGLGSAVAHAALRDAIAGRIPVARIDVSRPDHPELVFLINSAENLGTGIELLALGTAARYGLSVTLARTVGRDGRPVWAVAADRDPVRSHVEALRDVLGVVQLEREHPAEIDLGDPLLADFDPGTLRVGPELPATEQAVDWPTVLERLTAAGFGAVVVPVGSTDLRAGGIEMVRVLLTEGVTHVH